MKKKKIKKKQKAKRKKLAKLAFEFMVYKMLYELTDNPLYDYACSMAKVQFAILQQTPIENKFEAGEIVSLPSNDPKKMTIKEIVESGLIKPGNDETEIVLMDGKAIARAVKEKEIKCSLNK